MFKNIKTFHFTEKFRKHLFFVVKILFNSIHFSGKKTVDIILKRNSKNEVFCLLLKNPGNLIIFIHSGSVMLLYTSPEFEMCAYTITALVKALPTNAKLELLIFCLVQSICDFSLFPIPNFINSSCHELELNLDGRSVKLFAEMSPCGGIKTAFPRS